MILTFFLGCIGACAPEVVRLYRLRTNMPDFTPAYFLISAIYMAFAGCFAIFLSREGNVASAIYVGAAFPSIVAIAGRKGSKEAEGDVEETDSSQVHITDYLRLHLRAL